MMKAVHSLLSAGFIGLLVSSAWAASPDSRKVVDCLKRTGAVNGPVSLRDTVSPNATRVHEVVFEGEQRASIRVQGDHSTNLDCFVYDSYGQVIASDNDSSDYCVLSWTAARTERYRVHIRNHGKSYNEYRMTTN